ncbi:hypothetical protein R1sor_016412 [Riccia sorocarpa]|uniref:non-specific serine/threonine protein kinase n=1 Tax=Riccia sorocarpa TaxID=122646 RepID=A0ABD3HFC0_9MARC
MTGDTIDTSVLQRKTEDLHKLYKLGRRLGHFGATYFCQEKATGKAFACKTISKQKLLLQADVEDVRREIQIMHHLRGHPNVVMIRDAYEDDQNVYLVMELCAGGELFDRIVEKGTYSEAVASALIRTIVGVIAACHSLGVMHRDLNPKNFLLASNSEDAPLKATGFRLSVFFKPGEKFTDIVGSPYYIAPEMLIREYGPEADIWSAGVILYILLSGVPPFWGDTDYDLFKKILYGRVDYSSYPWPDISSKAKDLVKRMLEVNPKTRITAKEVLAHPWIAVGVAPPEPSDPAAPTPLKQSSSQNTLKKMAVRVIADNLSEAEIAELKEMYKAMDVDNSGNITYEDLRSGLQRVGLSEREIHNLRCYCILQADVDKDKLINYSEFIAANVTLQKSKEGKLLDVLACYGENRGHSSFRGFGQAYIGHNLGDFTLTDTVVDRNNVSMLYENKNEVNEIKEVQWSSDIFLANR